MTTILAILYAVLALLAQPPASPDFLRLLPTTAVVVADPAGFTGLEWRCRWDDDERCYAGYAGGEPSVGP